VSGELDEHGLDALLLDALHHALVDAGVVCVVPEDRGVVELEVRSAEVLFETSELDARLGQREHLALKRKPLFQLVELALPVLAVELGLVNPAGAALNVHIDEVGFDAGNPRLHALAEAA